jgi:hypothetical protein
MFNPYGFLYRDPSDQRNETTKIPMECFQHSNFIGFLQEVRLGRTLPSCHVFSFSIFKFQKNIGEVLRAMFANSHRIHQVVTSQPKFFHIHACFESCIPINP